MPSLCVGTGARSQCLRAGAVFVGLSEQLVTDGRAGDILCQHQEQIISSLRCFDLPIRRVPSSAHPSVVLLQAEEWL